MKPERRLGRSRRNRRVEWSQCILCDALTNIVIDSFYPFCRCIKAFKTLNQVVINVQLFCINFISIYMHKHIHYTHAVGGGAIL